MKHILRCLLGGAFVALSATSSYALTGTGSGSSYSTFWDCLQILKEDLATCTGAGIYADPAGEGITAITQVLDYDETMFSFNAAKSGVIGSFASGSIAPVTAPGVGTTPLQLFDANSMYTLGTSLPGTSLSVIDDGSVVSVSFTATTPIELATEENWFVFYFDLLTPVTLDLSTSTVTYSTSGGGTSFSEVSYACATESGGVCGSTHPSTGISFELSTVPLPAGAVLLPGALALLGFGARKKKRG